MNPLDLTTMLDPAPADTPILSAPFVIDDGDLQPSGSRIVGDAPAASDRDLEVQRPHNVPAPVPVIGVVPFGGVILDAGVLDNSAGSAPKVLTIGTNDKARPQVLGLLIRCTAGVASIMPNGSPDSLGLGFVIPVNTAAPFLYPLKRANLQVAVGGVVTYAVIGSDIPA